jgi:ribulose-5-phosphate 4-epimerase/fuculose-1-phosphate aldolase
VVCHVHGSYITALSCLFDPGPDTLPPLCPGHVYYARPLPLLPFYIPGTPELAQEVANAFAAEDVLALLLQNHGLITVGRTLAEAINIAEEIDEAAMVYLHTGGRGRRLGEDDVQTLMRQRRDAFGAGRSGSA